MRYHGGFAGNIIRDCPDRGTKPLGVFRCPNRHWNGPWTLADSGTIIDRRNSTPTPTPDFDRPL